ncbi:hypothetical protein FVW20_15435 [Desulfovibrio oxamicus]|uniref:Uncharacterized protein n=1 Tax=Nitratidesulfovibrio oxamicus TaxID=32016 RepID=A0ABS0J7D9_9BACT|nr:hypothetical protein [Nitratidesulfovibrio oxamicus]MBG3878366.1 hypothetical protein [Nitratidesulfovibrio oxamicus]
MVVGKVRTSPRISLNKLGEYLVSKPGRRRTIIRDQKEPSDFIVARYAEAKRIIQDCLVSGGADVRPVNRAIEGFSGSYETKWQKDTAILCASALRAFLRMSASIPLNGFNPVRGIDNPEKMNISGVDVSVCPEIILLAPSQDNAIVGGVKLYFSKNNPLTEDASEFVGSVLYRYLSEVTSSESAVSYKNCTVVDVFAGKCFIAPKTYKRNMNDVAAACAEIYHLWNVA